MSPIDKEALAWALRQAGRPLSESERAAFENWRAADIRHQGALLRAVAINRALDQAMVQKTLRPRRDRLALEWAGASWKQACSRREFFLYGGAAAGVAFL